MNVELGPASDGFLEESDDIDSSYVGTSKALRPEKQFWIESKSNLTNRTSKQYEQVERVEQVEQAEKAR